MAVCDSVARPLGHVPSQSVEMVSDSTKILFGQSRSGLDLSLDGNRERLDNLIRKIKDMSGQDSTFVISTLRVIGSASPEGSELLNRRLSEKRARALLDYLTRHIELPDSITDFEYLGRNWRGLYRLVASDPTVPSQAEVLSMLEKALEAPELSTVDSNLLLYHLQRLNGGVPYAYIYRHLFPALRYSYLYVEYEKQRTHRDNQQSVSEPVGTVETVDNDSTVSTPLFVEEIVETEEIIPAAVIAADVKRPFYMDLHTNMLYDIAAVPNLGMEFYLGKRISILADWMYGWWDNDSRHRYWRIYGGELGARWWFGRKAAAKPLTGHHLGIYSGVLTFDFEWGGTGYMGGKPGGTLWDRCLINSGIEYGFSLPVGSRLNIDFSIGIGFLGGNYIKYFPFDHDYYRQKEYKMRYFGPTKVGISLVWLIGRGNTNKRKGGDK